MAKFYKLFLLFTLAWVALCIVAPRSVSAHEQYVLSKQQFDLDYANSGINVFDALKSPENLRIAIEVGVGIIILFALYLIFLSSRLEFFLDQALGHLEPASHALVRIAIGFSFIYSAATAVYLGPEISLASLPWGGIIQYALYVLGIFLVFGFVSELAGLLSLAIIIAATFIYKDYMLTYFNYFGEFLALLLFGSRIFSLDKLLFGLKRLAEKSKDYEIAILRITYGISILYPAISVKLIHPAVIMDIVRQYHLNRIHWLFPADPLLIALGAGLTQIVVGICLIIGFETRLNSFITFILYVLSILFFREVVWPHYILLALSLYLVINNGSKFTIDNLVERMRERRRGVCEKPIADL